MDEQALSIAIEDLLVSRNLRQMQQAQAALTPGYYLRAARWLRDIDGCVLIGTGFPVTGTFETDGPVGAIALSDTLESLGADCWLACGKPLSRALAEDYQVLELEAKTVQEAEAEASRVLAELRPQAIVSIERPGLCIDGKYHNMRGEDISERCAIFDPYMAQADCPTIAVGDGGNEIGMGNIKDTVEQLDIAYGAVTGCDELLVADVSNWGAYGLIAFLSLWAGRDLLAEVSPADILDYLSIRGSVDGVTRENTTTEDGLDQEHGYEVINAIRQVAGLDEL